MPVTRAPDLVTSHLRQDWNQAVDRLESEGEEIAGPAQDARVLDPREEHVNNVGNRVVVHCYSPDGRATTPTSWGNDRASKDSTVNIDTRAGGGNAKQLADDAVDVIERILALNRKHPSDEWDLIENWDTVYENSYTDYQQRITTAQLTRHSRPLPTAKADKPG